MSPQVVKPGIDCDDEDYLVHDERGQDSTLATLLSRLRYPEFPEMFGVLRDVERPIYEDLAAEQIRLAQEKSAGTDLNSLFNSGDTWEVSA